MAKLRITTAELVAQARNEIQELDNDQAEALLQKDDVVFVDIRDIRERQRSGFIPNSIHCPRGMLEFWVDPDSPYHKPIFSEDKRFILYCASGWRSALSSKTLQDMGFSVEHLRDGFTGWTRAEKEIQTDG